MSSKILVLPGDGIGVEVADQAIRVIDKLNELGLDATYEKELEWYNSDLYKPLKELRQKGSKGNIIIIKGA